MKQTRNVDKKTHWLYTKPIAHRGLHDKTSPENSLSAIRKACEKGYAVEIDVHFLKDEGLAVFHDYDLNRMCGKDVKIADLEAKDLKKYPLLGTEECIPLLPAVLKLCEAQHAPLLIEIKAEDKVGRLEQELYAALRTYKGDFAIQSFNPLSVKWFKKNAPKMIRGQLASAFKDDPKMSSLKKKILSTCKLNFLTRPDFIAYNEADLPNEAIAKIREKGVAVLAWTVRSKKRADELKPIADNIIFEGWDI